MLYSGTGLFLKALLPFSWLQCFWVLVSLSSDHFSVCFLALRRAALASFSSRCAACRSSYSACSRSSRLCMSYSSVGVFVSSCLDIGVSPVSDCVHCPAIPGASLGSDWLADTFVQFFFAGDFLFHQLDEDLPPADCRLAVRNPVFLFPEQSPLRHDRDLHGRNELESEPLVAGPHCIEAACLRG